MPASSPPLMKASDLVRAAHLQAVGVTKEQRRQSLPVPSLRPEGPQIIFFFSPTQIAPGVPAQLSPPDHFLRMQASGAFIELRAVTPKELGQSHTPGEPFGTHGMPPGLTYDQAIEKQQRLYALYDLLLPEYFARRSPRTAEFRAAAKEFISLFRLLSEAPLLPYYQAFGQDFFAWVDQAER